MTIMNKKLTVEDIERIRARMQAAWKDPAIPVPWEYNDLVFAELPLLLADNERLRRTLKTIADVAYSALPWE
jgi:hypothetical protein